jgi:hypothetical protein
MFIISLVIYILFIYFCIKHIVNTMHCIKHHLEGVTQKEYLHIPDQIDHAINT